MNNLEEKIKEIEKQLEELKGQLTEEDKEDKYKRKRNSRYYYLNSCGAIYNVFDNEIASDNFRYSTGNFFETSEEVKIYQKKLIIEQELKDIAKELNKGEKIDWNNKEQNKCFLCFDYFYNKIDYIQNRYNKIQGTIYCLDNTFKDVAIERIGEERLKKYLKGELD
jgi:hypothetical protein